MLANGQFGVEGDYAFIESSAARQGSNKCVLFDVFLTYDVHSHTNDLIVTLTNASNKYALPLSYHSLSDHDFPIGTSGWERVALPLPPDQVVKVGFGYYMGFPFECAAALDNIDFDECPEESTDTVRLLNSSLPSKN